MAGAFGATSVIVIQHSIFSFALFAMGASQSKAESDEKVFYNEIPIQVRYLALGVACAHLYFSIRSLERMS